MDPIEMTATSAVPPPISTIMQPVGSATGSPAPMAACLAPALKATSRTARRSTAVTPLGMQMTTRGRLKVTLPSVFLMKSCSILAAISKSAMTPSLRGRTATMEAGVRPTTSLASSPTNFTVSLRISTATTLGSRRMMPLPFI